MNPAREKCRRRGWLQSVALAVAIISAAPAPATSIDPDQKGFPLFQLVMLEILILGTAAMSTVPNGNRPMGAITGIGGAAFVTIPLIWDSRAATLPELSIPYGVGLMALSFHNYENLEGADRHRRFRENAYGLNIAVLGSLVVALLVDRPRKEEGQSGLRFSPRPGGAEIRWAEAF